MRKKHQNQRAKYRRNRPNIVVAEWTKTLIEDIRARERRKLYQRYPDMAPDEMERRVETILKRHDVEGQSEQWGRALLPASPPQATKAKRRGKAKQDKNPPTHRVGSYEVAKAFKPGSGRYS